VVASASSAAVEAYRLLRAGRLAEALLFAERSIVGVRVCLPAHACLATILLQLGRGTDADRVIDDALALESGSADAYDGLGFVSLALGRHDRANDLYRRATQIEPHVPRFWYNLACSERAFGKLDEAEAACDRAIAIDRTEYPTYLLRSELRVQVSGANHVAELEALLMRPDLSDRGRMFLGYALGKELDDLERFDEAYGSFAAAAAARRSRLSYDVAKDEHKLRRIAEAYPRESFMPPVDGLQMPDRGVDSSRYIFVVGLPRSGTTLTERILTGLPGVRSNGETANFPRALISASRGSGDEFTRAAAADPQSVAAGYGRLADPGIGGERIVEKLPLNYLYVGAIHRALPDAKILLVQRSPLDSCFAMYRTLFGAAYPFSYDFEELGRYYAAYEQLMRHWRAALGERLQEIVYEDLVREPKRVGAAVAEYCGLPWSDAAIEIQKNRSVSFTASAAQIRRPIYGTSSGRWRHYRRHLGPLIEALHRHGVTVPA
jgi:tetratricopeptide (TPR) repeat protein